MSIDNISLYKVPMGTKVRVQEDIVKTAMVSLEVNKGEILKPIRVDGMYVHCKNDQDEDVYVAAWTLVEQLD